jgi:hypothetical protein
LPVLITHKYKRRAAGCCRGGKWRVEREREKDIFLLSLSLSFLDLEPGKKKTYIHTCRESSSRQRTWKISGKKVPFFGGDGKPDE